MVGSADSLDYLPDLSMSNVYEATPIPMDCWESVCLSKIWIPSYLLPSRKNPPDTRAAQGVFHTLQKKDHAKCIESFSVYSDSDDHEDDEEEEIFLSDSDEVLGLDTFSYEKIDCSARKSVEKNSAVTTNISLKNKHSKKGESLAANENYDNRHSKNIDKLKSKLKSFSSLNNLSLTDTEKNTQFAGSNDRGIDSSLNKFKIINDNNQNVVRVKSANVAKPLSISNTTCESYKFSENSDAKHKTKEQVEVTAGAVNMKRTYLDYNTEENQASNISLHEILDNTVETNMKDVLQNFTVTKKDNASEVQGSYGEPNKKRNKKEKRKKKTAKAIGLGEFLEDYDEVNRQDDYCRDYLRKLLAEQNRGEGIQTRNPVEFPDLTAEEVRFMKSQQAENDTKPKVKTFAEIFAHVDKAKENQSLNASGESYENQSMSDSGGATNKFELEPALGKIAIENIPREVNREDVSLFLSGYGELKSFSLVPHGRFHKAIVEIALICDIDWIIECLNGTEPFGASDTTLKCYKL